MDTYQSPLQIISQQESHQSHQVGHQHHHHFQQPQSLHNPHHQQVYLIEFQPHHMSANPTTVTSPAGTSLEHLHHNAHHQHHQQHQQQHHVSPLSHHQQHHANQALGAPQPQAMHPAHHHAHIGSNTGQQHEPYHITLLNVVDGQHQQQHLMNDANGPLLNGASNAAGSNELNSTTSQYCQNAQTVVSSPNDVSSGGSMDQSPSLINTNSNGTSKNATNGAGVGNLMIDPYSGHAAHHATLSTATTNIANGNSPGNVNSQSQQQQQDQDQPQPQPQLSGHLNQQVSNNFQHQPYQTQAGQQQHLYHAPASHMPSLHQLQDSTTANSMNGRLISNGSSTPTTTTSSTASANNSHSNHNSPNSTNNINNNNNNSGNNNNNMMAPNHHNGIMMKAAANFISNNNNQEEYSEIITDYQTHHTLQAMHLSHASSQQQLDTSPNTLHHNQHQQAASIQLHSSPNGLQHHAQHQQQLHLHHHHHQSHLNPHHGHHLLQPLHQQSQTIQLQPQQTNLTNLVTTVAHHQSHQVTGVPLQQQVQLQHHQTGLPVGATTITATSTTPNNQPVRRKRKRCGVCPGCEHKDNCGECGPCKSVRSHQICKMRKCDKLKHKRQTAKKQQQQQQQQALIGPAT